MAWWNPHFASNANRPSLRSTYNPNPLPLPPSTHLVTSPIMRPSASTITPPLCPPNTAAVLCSITATGSTARLPAWLSAALPPPLRSNAPCLPGGSSPLPLPLPLPLLLPSGWDPLLLSSGHDLPAAAASGGEAGGEAGGAADSWQCGSRWGDASCGDSRSARGGDGGTETRREMMPAVTIGGWPAAMRVGARGEGEG